ncbi:M48 family metalloprotease [Pseudoduganella namucuonensis]|uniref:Peptidase family M48 n=1 Tax=Pseudoduganella namucuonensis TaxID=1035707 RepID=A0A1I7J6U6_9BURK|nr:M48 family metalloprotease [Pseudoduganella namucuonensis]SFU80926.1 Peptidase family M48 [Pseudoduganella namucuonensis]
MRRMLAAPLLALSLVLHPGPAAALSQEEVMAGAARLYRERMEELRVSRRLDADRAFHERVLRIAGPLIARAARDWPETARWDWEIHTTPDGDDHAYAMAGGKLLVSRAHARELELSDAELAMVLAHEIAHAALRHNLLEYEEAVRLEPAWAARPFAELEHAVDHDTGLMRKLAPLGILQEQEADREGMLLAWRAGWPALALARYFQKAARASSSPNFEQFAHPSPSSRWQAARELAATLP